MPESIRVVDDHAAPLAAWTRRVSACGMRFLRSPGAHSIDPSFAAIGQFASRNDYDRDRHRVEPYARPSVELFQSYASASTAWIQERGVWQQGRVVDVHGDSDGYLLELADGGRLHSARVILAIGGSDRLRVPEWATGSAVHLIAHAFSRQFNRSDAESATAPLIVGGGITAVQIALALARARSRTGVVRVVSRHPLRVSQFDSDPCFLGQRCLANYYDLQSVTEKRRAIAHARNSGSLPPDLHQQLCELLESGRAEFIEDEIVASDRLQSGVRLMGRRGQYESDSVTLATGFGSSYPGADLLGRISKNASDDERLAFDEAGAPLLSADLSWSPGLYVTGRLAEIELGPSAGNIIGAHNAAKRILSSLRGSPRRLPAAWWNYAPASVSSSSASC